MPTSRATRDAEIDGAGSFRPVRILEVELSEPLPTVDATASRSGAPYGSAQVLVRFHGAPLGTIWLDLTGGPVDAAALASEIDRRLGDRVTHHVEADRRLGGPGRCRDRFRLPEATPMVSVVVATFHRPQMLPACIDSVLANDHPDFEVLVVDNGPDDERTATVVAERYGDDPRVRYFQERAPGTSHARNTGTAAARGEIIAFTDDDVVVDRGWISGLAAAVLADRGIACVTGLTQPYELETEPQVWFEQYGGMGHGVERREFHLSMPDPPSVLFPFTPGVGSSNNMAIRRAVALDLDGFDVRLGPGTPTGGGEDLDLFVRLLLSGHRIVYEPRGIVWHRHRIEADELRGHVFGYGAGSIAVLTKWFLRRPDLRRRVARQAPHLLAAFGPRTGPTTDPASVPPAASTHPPRRLARAQLAGALVGPFRWLRSASREKGIR